MNLRNLMPVVAIACLAAIPAAQAQLGQPAPPPPGPAKAEAPFDITGYWVSVVTEDWRVRMSTPQIGDHVGIPLTPEATQLADNWDPQADIDQGLECKAFGAGRIMREPGRLHITWDGEDTLRIETDAGEQTRLLRFRDEAEAVPGDPSWQGFSEAEWLFYGGGPRGGERTGTLKATTTNLRPGYLRKNGVPYSADAVVTEYIDHITEPNGDEYLIVKTHVSDPNYLREPYITSTNFRKMDGKDGWNPRPCKIDLPPPGKPAGFG